MEAAEYDKPVANPLIVLREEFDNWAILFDPDSGAAAGLNPTGVFIWKLLNGANTMKEILERVRAGCKDAPHQVEEDIRDFINGLAERGWVGYEVKKS